MFNENKIIENVNFSFIRDNFAMYVTAHINRSTIKTLASSAQRTQNVLHISVIKIIMVYQKWRYLATKHLHH